MTIISILMPIYNGFEFLNQSLTSIINQTFTDWELIIGINGHPQNSQFHLQVVNFIALFNDNRIKVIHYLNFGNKPKTLNLMINDCSSDLIAILDVDDFWHKKKLEIQLPFLNNYDVVGTSCQYFGDNTNIPNLPYGNLNDFDFFSYNPIINSSVILKKNIAIWNEETIIEDYDLWLNLFYLQKKSFFNINQILCFHRIHNNSSFNNINHLYVDELKNKWKTIINS